MEARPAAYTLRELAARLAAEPEYPDAAPGRAEMLVTGLAPLADAAPGELSFLARASLAGQLDATRASAVLVNRDFARSAAELGVPLLRVANAYLAYAQASALFDRTPRPSAGIHASAVIDPSAQVAVTAAIGPHAVVEAGAVIGDHCVLEAGVVVGASARLGRDCHLHSRAVVCHRVVIGDRVRIHSSAVIGADGFGFAPKPGGGWEKIRQLGSVRIGSDVEIGANTTIDRGALDDTVIEDGVIIDNQVQIAHNVRIGKNTAIAACVGIAGSTHIGAQCTIAGAAGIVGHLTIVDHVHITAMTLVTGSIHRPGSYSGGTGVSETRQWRRNVARFNQLDELAKRVKDLEKKS